MRLAVLPVSCRGAPRVTTLTRDWIHRLITHCAGYYLQQSGGRENMEFRVFDWVELDMNGTEWNEAGFGISDIVIPRVSDRLDADLSLYSHFAIVIDKSDASLGVRVPGKPHLLLGAQSLDPALTQHEMGHLLNATHANLATANGPSEYDDAFCVMGREGSKYSFVHVPLNLETSPGVTTAAFSDSGPGMIAPNLIRCGWLNPQTHGVDVRSVLTSPPFEATVELTALTGTPAPDNPRRVIAFAEDFPPGRRLTLEYRVRSEYDRGLPTYAAGGAGYVVCHQSDATNLQVGVTASAPGQSLYAWETTLRATVLQEDVNRGTAIVRLTRESWCPWFVPKPIGQLSNAREIAAVARRSDHLDVFAVHRDGHVWSSWWNEAVGWQDWFPIGAEVFAFDAPVTAVARHSGQLDLFITGFNGAVWTAWWNEATGWNGWVMIHPQTVFRQDRAVAAIARLAEHLDLFRVGFDGAIWSAWWHGEGDPQGWRPWFQIHPQTRFSAEAEVTAIARMPEHIDLFVVGLDGRVWSAWWHGEGDPAGWRAWFPLPGDVRFDPSQKIAAIARGPNHLDLFCIAPDGSIWSAWWHADEIGWRAWFPLFAEHRFHIRGRVTALSREENHLDVFAVKDDGTVWSSWWHADETGWRAWFPIQPATVFNPRLAITPLARRSDHIDLFAAGNDSNAWTTFWHSL